jgi:hypothetical protein
MLHPSGWEQPHTTQQDTPSEQDFAIAKRVLEWSIGKDANIIDDALRVTIYSLHRIAAKELSS